jgi:hypothetical protein
VKEEKPRAQPVPKEDEADEVEFATSFSAANNGMSDFQVKFRIDYGEIATWSMDRVNAFFRGLALVVAAKNAREVGEIEREIKRQDS